MRTTRLSLPPAPAKRPTPAPSQASGATAAAPPAADGGPRKLLHIVRHAENDNSFRLDVAESTSDDTEKARRTAATPAGPRKRATASAASSAVAKLPRCLWRPP